MKKIKIITTVLYLVTAVEILSAWDNTSLPPPPAGSSPETLSPHWNPDSRTRAIG